MSSDQPSIWQILFKKAIRKLKDFDTVDQKQCLAMAMAMATKIERGHKEPHSLCSPSQIEAETSLSIADQHEYGVCLKKHEALEFLNRFTKRYISQSSFMRRNTQDRYQQVFFRDGHAVGRQAMVATFAEWLYLEKYLFPLTLPQEFVSFLPEDWEISIGIKD